MRITHHTRSFCQAVGAKLKRQNGQVYLHYDNHGSVVVENESAFRESMIAYKSGHPKFEEAFGDYCYGTGDYSHAYGDIGEFYK